MDFLINESQLRTILTEQDKSKMTDYMKVLYSFTNNIVGRVLKSYGLNLKMLLTWGTSVGGMVMPLDNFIKTGNFDLTDDQRYLILAGVAFIIFFESKKGLVNILEQIKEEGLEDTFRTVLEKAKDLKSSFKGFLNSLKVTSSSFMETVAYSFLIPIILDIQNIAYNTSDSKEAAIHIAERLIASGVIIVGSQSLSQVLRKIIEKLR
jgi:hypothetical protein